MIENKGKQFPESERSYAEVKSNRRVNNHIFQRWKLNSLNKENLVVEVA